MSEFRMDPIGTENPLVIFVLIQKLLVGYVVEKIGDDAIRMERNVSLWLMLKCCIEILTLPLLQQSVKVPVRIANV